MLFVVTLRCTIAVSGSTEGARLARHSTGAQQDAVSFRSLVRHCAAESQLVASFNRVYGMQLQAPVTALLEDRWPHALSGAEQLQVGCFILFVHKNLWERFKRAQADGAATRKFRCQPA